MTRAAMGGQQQSLAALLRTLTASVDGNLGDAVLRGLLAPTAADFVVVHCVRETSLEIVAHAGVPRALAQHYATVPLAMQTPMSEAIRTGNDMTLDAQHWASAFPLAALLSREIRGPRPTLTVRVLRRAGVPTGTVTIGFPTPPADTGEWHDRLAGLTDALSLWSFGSTVPSIPVVVAPPHETVTPRQREILALVSEGLTNPQIAERTDVSVATVKAELSWLFTLLGAKRRAELPARAIRAGL